MKKYGHIWIGMGAILLAVLLVLGVIFIPRLAARSDMKELLSLAAAPDAQYVLLSDPTFKHAGIPPSEGREVMLTGEVLESTRALLLSLREELSYHKKTSEMAGSLGMHLQVKTADGEIIRIYFTEGSVYAVLKGSAYHFKAEGCAALYSALQAAFSS